MRSKKKTNLRKRILAAFSFVLFFSFMLTGILFNVLMRQFSAYESYYYIHTEQATGRASIILFILVSIIFVVAVIVTYFLSNSITRPIEKLGKFARSIGKSGFDTNNFEFRDVELENLNVALNKAVKQIKAYDSEQKDFFQNASHELRTPLMSIKCYAEGIVYGLMEPKQASETILEETDKLSELVTDLLYIAKIDNITTAYTAEKTDLIKIIKDCTARQQAIADKRQINFVYDFASSYLHCECIAELVSRAVDNLISNALRYASSEIVLTCATKGSKIQITVADDGNGIEAEVLPHIFERFYKGKGGNTGIGLSIVKSIADQHNGYVTAENASSGGAVFTLALPIYD